MRTEQPSPLSSDERAPLDGFLSQEFPGVQELRQQAQHITAKKGCNCGCGTIEFVHDERPATRSPATNPVPVDAPVVASDGSDLGGLILFVRDGLLQSLEVYSHSEPLPLPKPGQVTWRI